MEILNLQMDLDDHLKIKWNKNPHTKIYSKWCGLPFLNWNTEDLLKSLHGKYKWTIIRTSKEEAGGRRDYRKTGVRTLFMGFGDAWEEKRKKNTNFVYLTD